MNIWSRLNAVEAWVSDYIEHRNDRAYKHTEFLRKDSIISCEDCGCLLDKKPEFKRDSTISKYIIKTETIYEPVVGYSSGYSGPFTVTKEISPPPDNWTGEAKEKLIEHYKCRRCFKENS